MTRTRSELLIDEVALWSSLVIYFVVWLAFLSAGFEGRLLLPSLGVSGVYVGMHAYEITKRGHCYLSADSTAAPVTVVFTILGILLTHFTIGVGWKQLGEFFARGCASFMLAHIAALAYSALLVSLGALFFSRRIASEKSSSATASDERFSHRT